MSNEQTSSRRRSRISQPSESEKSNESVSIDTSGWMSTGVSVLDKAQSVQEQAEIKRSQGRAPNRFWLASDPLKGATEKEIVILNKCKTDPTIAGFFEHEIWGPKAGKPNEKMMYRASCVDQGHDPLIDITGKQPPEFMKTLDIIEKAKGTFRGAVMVLRRNTSDKKSPKIGSPAPLDNGMIYDFMTEEELISEFGHDEIKTENGEVIHSENALLQPYTPSDIYPTRPTADSIRAEFGGSSSLGSESYEDGWGDPSTSHTNQIVPESTQDTVDVQEDPFGED